MRTLSPYSVVARDPAVKPRDDKRLGFATTLLAMAACIFALLLTSPAHAREYTCPARDETYVPINHRLKPALLFRVCREGRAPSYILGTFHSDSPAIKPIYRDAFNVLRDTQQLGLELVISEEMRRKAQTSLLLPADHPGLKSMLGEELFAKTVAALGPILQADAATLDRYTPWALAVLVQYPKPEADGIVLDEQLQRAAEKRKLPVFGLETLDEQFAVFSRMKESDQIAFLITSIDDIDALDAMQEELKQHYLARDLPAILEMSDTLFADMENTHPDLSRYLKLHILTRRNQIMADRLQPRLTKPTLTAIGALHLPGDDGVLALLEAEGYSIEAVK